MKPVLALLMLALVAGCCSQVPNRSAVVNVSGGTNTISVSNHVEAGGTLTPTLEIPLGK